MPSTEENSPETAGAERSFRAGIGDLTLQYGPRELRMWTLQQPLASALSPTPVTVNIMLEGTDDLDRANLALIAEVVADPDRYLEAALRHVHQELLADPGFFELTEADVEPYRVFRLPDFPLGSPGLTFYTSADWCIFFDEGRLPICDPYGLSVAFEHHRPVRVEDWQDAEILD